MWEIVFTEDALTFLESLDPETRKDIFKRIEKLSFIPYRQGKPLSGPLKGYRRLRIGAYRVVFALDHSSKTVLVIAVGHRKSIYQRLSRLSSLS